MDTKPLASRNFLVFPGCKTCLARPCERLRFGRVFPGKFLFVHRRELGFGEKGCPFVATSFDEVRELLSDLSLTDLMSCCDDIIYALSVEEQHAHDQRQFVNGYDDFEGWLRFCEALWDDNILGVVSVPLFTTNKGMAQWLYVLESLDYTLKNNIKPEAAQAAVTDSMANQPAAQHESAAPKQEKKKEKGSYCVRLNIDPNHQESQDDTFTMFSTDAAKTYSKVLTVKDDRVAGDACTDLTFADLDKSLSYSLEIDPGKEGDTFFLFENKSYGELNGN
jgi:hypothetical protein